MIKIKRAYYDEYTLGILEAGDFKCFTLELPSLNNQQDISCIYAAGGFSGYKHVSMKNGDCIAIDNVMNRTNIQIHVANWLRDIKGCIAVGDSITFDRHGDIMVTNSRKTMNALLAVLDDSFNVEIS